MKLTLLLCTLLISLVVTTHQESLTMHVTKMPLQGVLDDSNFPYGWGLGEEACLLVSAGGAQPLNKAREVKRGK